VQAQRLENLDQAVKDKLAELDQTISLRRKGDTVGALSIVRSDHGKVLMDRIRSLVTTMGAAERAALGERQDQWQHAEFISSAVTFWRLHASALLIGAAAVLTSRDYRARQAQVWLRTGQMAFGQRIQGEQRLERLGEHVLSFLGSFLGARVGALYIAEERASFDDLPLRRGIGRRGRHGTGGGWTARTSSQGEPAGPRPERPRGVSPDYLAWVMALRASC